MKNHILPLFLAALMCAASCKPEADLHPTSVSVSPSSASITEGETANFSATVLPADAVYSGIIWSSSNTKVATVNNGVVTGVEAGTATITASADGVSGTATVTVNAKVYPVESVSLDKTEIELTEGDEAQLKATVAPDNSTDKNVNWKSADETIATVTDEGKVTAVAPGETIIIVTTADGGKTATCKVTVNAKIYPVESITLDKTALTLTEGGSAQLTATVKPDNATNKNVTWSSSSRSVRVSVTGKVTAVQVCTATITATTEDGGKTATCTVTVLENIDGALTGMFSVSDTKKIRFSKGNLQAAYVHRPGVEYVWGFAAHQYEYIGNAPGNTTIDSQTSGAKVDLFCWSTPASYFGISTKMKFPDYPGEFVEWGKNIGDGSTWRTLTKDEWVYLFETRADASKLYETGVTVCGKENCVVIAPDGFTGTIAASYDASTWSAAEAAGLVCLPSAGHRNGSSANFSEVYGAYWSSTPNTDQGAYMVEFDSEEVETANLIYRVCASSVRLITDVK